jgi:adenylate cyclase class 2
LKKEIGRKETELAKQKLHSLLLDLLDLINDEDRKRVLKITGANLGDIANQVLTENIPSLIFSAEFAEVISNYNTNPNKWVRLRASNGKFKIALKQIYNRRTVDGVRQHSINDVKEIEVEVDSIENGKLLLEELGYFHKNYQEKKRISFILENNVHVDIDMWPHIPPYLEVEADNERTVYAVLEKLNFKKEDARILNADDVFTFYGLNMYSYKELKFE